MADDRQALIKLDGVTKVFFTEDVETHALSGIHMEIGKGEYVSIAGPSGCGKSTLLSILGLLDSPTEGQYMLNNRPVAELAASERARVRNREIGFIFQSFNLIGDLTVFENVELPLTYRGMKAAERQPARRSRARARGHGPPRQAPPEPALGRSAAARRRRARRRRRAVDSARGRAHGKPRLAQRRSASWICCTNCISAGATICMVTHDPRYARHAERSIHLFDGRVVEERTEMAVTE